jgi:hypothetical protein
VQTAGNYLHGDIDKRFSTTVGGMAGTRSARRSAANFDAVVTLMQFAF